jgi:hypothetical protein
VGENRRNRNGFDILGRDDLDQTEISVIVKDKLGEIFGNHAKREKLASLTTHPMDMRTAEAN